MKEKKSTLPKISVIIPMYNVAGYIGKTIESLQGQTLDDWELILVDDASTDETLSVVKEYAVKDNRLHVIACTENYGPMYAREMGCQTSKGEYVTFCDGDDELLPESLDLLYKTAISEQADVVIGKVLEDCLDGNRKPFSLQPSLRYGNDNESFLKSVLRREIHQGLWGKLFHSEIVRNANITIFEHCTMSEDAAVLFQYIERCHKVCIIEEYVYCYNKRTDSLAHSAMSQQQLEAICKTSLLRKDIMDNHPKLYRDFNRYIIENMVNLSPYNYDRILDSLLKEYGLKTILSPFNFFICFSIKSAMFFLTKWYVNPIRYKIKRKLKK